MGHTPGSYISENYPIGFRESMWQEHVAPRGHTRHHEGSNALPRRNVGCLVISCGKVACYWHRCVTWLSGSAERRPQAQLLPELEQMLCSSFLSHTANNCTNSSSKWLPAPQNSQNLRWGGDWWMNSRLIVGPCFLLAAISVTPPPGWQN